MERLIVVIHCFSNEAERIYGLLYESKERFLSDIQSELDRITNGLKEIPEPVWVDEDLYQLWGNNDPNLLPIEDFRKACDEHRASSNAIHKLKNSFAYQDVLNVSYGQLHYAQVYDKSSITVYTVDDFFNDPQRLLNMGE